MFARRARRQFASHHGWNIAILLAFAAQTQANEIAEDQSKLIEAGAKLFAHQWQVNDPMSRGGDGLGPVYNDTSCAACHNLGGTGGAGTVEKNVQLVANAIVTTSIVPSRAGRTGNRSFSILSASVLHRFGTSEDYANWRERRLRRAPALLQLPSMQRADTSEKTTSGNESDDSSEKRIVGLGSLTERNATSLFGDGLINQIPDVVIQSQVKSQQGEPLNTIAKSARLPVAMGRVVTLADGRVGKFGWKAQQATVTDFALAACEVEIGLEVPKNSQLPDPTNPEEKPRGLDMNQADCDALVAFVASLPPPRRATPEGATRESVMVGEVFFERVGCAACHKPRLGEIDGIYSDLLVHDMGQELSDPSTYYGQPVTDDAKPSLASPASASEWRTPPLWGVADSGPYLHDGRARTLKEAILRHDGQGSDSANRFSALTNDEQAAVVDFLRSLKAPHSVPSPDAVTQVSSP